MNSHILSKMMYANKYLTFLKKQKSFFQKKITIFAVQLL